MIEQGLLRLTPHSLAAAVCLGIAAANLARISGAAAVLGAAIGAATLAAAGSGPAGRLLLGSAVAMLIGWWWGSARLNRLDQSVLISQVDRAEQAIVVVTAPPRRGRYELRVPVEVRRFGRLGASEPAQLELPLGRAPPQGAVIALLATVRLPRGAADGFDERTWLRRHGVHVVLRADRWRLVGHRGGLGGFADRLRARLARSIAPRLRGERRALLEGVVLGEDQRLSPELRDRFRASGLYHLLAVSGQNVALVAGGMLVLGWLLGLSRAIAEVGALTAIVAYVLAVGAQPSVIRAGIAGALGSFAWLTARDRDRWYFLLLGALALLAWNPYVLFDPGFELSFVAVGAIFTLAPRLRRVLEGYPLPHAIATVTAVSAACGAATMPILWLQFGAVPLLTVPANVLAAPAVPPLLGFALATAALEPVAPGAAAALAQVNGVCAAYLAACARLIGGLPFAQVRAAPALLALTAAAVVGAAYAWRVGRPQARLHADRHRPPEGRTRAPAASRTNTGGSDGGPVCARDER